MSSLTDINCERRFLISKNISFLIVDELDRQQEASAMMAGATNNMQFQGHYPQPVPANTIQLSNMYSGGSIPQPVSKMTPINVDNTNTSRLFVRRSLDMNTSSKYPAKMH